MCATSAQGVAFVLFAGLSTTSTKHVVPLMFCRAAPPAQISRSVITKEELSQGPMKGRPKIKTEFLALLTKVGLGRPRVPNSGTDSGPDFSHSLFIYIYIKYTPDFRFKQKTYVYIYIYIYIYICHHDAIDQLFQTFQGSSPHAR